MHTPHHMPSALAQVKYVSAFAVIETNTIEVTTNNLLIIQISSNIKIEIKKSNSSDFFSSPWGNALLAKPGIK